MNTLSVSQARRIALAAQGLDGPRPAARIDARHLRREIQRLGLLQLDFVNVLAPAHQMVLYSRLGRYDPARLDDVIYRRGEFTEQWAHERSVVPVSTWPLLRHRFAGFRIRPWGAERFVEEHQNYMQAALDRIRREGPLAADAFDPPNPIPDYYPVGVSYTIQKATLEAHFAWGNLTVVERRSDNACVYDLAERALPEEHRTLSLERQEAQRRLLLLAARSHGVGTARDLADYYRMALKDARSRLGELADAGALEQVHVEGWKETAYLHPDARLPRSADAASLLSPFDPLIWFRPRTERLFGFHYRIEIYVPAKKRQWGYYVLPFLLGDRLVGRVDLKSDRKEGRLLVQAAWVEEHADPGVVAVALAAELEQVAAWQALDDVVVRKKGNLAGALRKASR